MIKRNRVIVLIKQKFGREKILEFKGSSEPPLVERESHACSLPKLMIVDNGELEELSFKDELRNNDFPFLPLILRRNLKLKENRRFLGIPGRT